MVEILSLTSFLHDRISSHQLTAAELEQTLLRFREQVARYKQEIYTSLSSGTGASLSPQYLQAATAALESFSDQVYSGVIEISRNSSDELQRYFMLLSTDLTEMLSLLHHLAPQVFDQSQKVPYSQVMLLEKETSAAFKAMRTLQKRLDVHTAELVPILQHLIEENVIYGISFRRYEYLRLLLSSLIRLPTVKVKDYNFLLHHHLIMLNFNHPDYISFCNGKLEEKFDNLSSEEKVREYRKYDMNLSRILPGKNISFNELLPSAKEALHVYVKEEMTFLYPADSGTGEIKKIHTDFTVAQLGLFGKIAKQAGQLTDSSMIGLYRLMCQYFTARGTESISPESIQSKGNAATPETKVSMINIMLKWIELIRAS